MSKELEVLRGIGIVIAMTASFAVGVIVLGKTLLFLLS